MLRPFTGRFHVGAVWACALAASLYGVAWAQNPPATANDAFTPKADASRAQLKSHLDRLKKVPLAARTQGYGQGLIMTAEKILADEPPESLRAQAAISLLDGLHIQAAVENNADAEAKLSEQAQQFKTDKDKKVSAAATLYDVEVRILKAGDIAPAQIPALVEELKIAFKGKRPDATYQRLAEATTTLVNRLEAEVQKEKEFKEVGKLFSTSLDRGLAEYGNKMKSLQLIGVAKPAAPMDGTVAEMDWVGKPMLVAGTTADGRPFDLSTYKGKVVLVDFWATWCGPCKALIPHVKETYAKYHDKGFEVVGVSLDQKLDSLREFIVQEQLPWVNVIGEMQGDKMMFPIAATYNVRAIPTTFLVDKEGKIAGYNLHGEALDKQIDQLLQSPDVKKTAAK
ncbi:MAG: redoxin domain-containing protein [Pirellulales bacterium]|nr:redoxin domain-containing protein [Pirellulales bacterium]